MEVKEKNELYRAFEPQDAEIKDGYYIVPVEKVRGLYDARYCAVAGFIYAYVDNELCVLANKRGKGTPDFQGYWNCPCGYLERSESGKEGISRETYEECGILIEPIKFIPMHTQTEPKLCNHGNVTIHYKAFLTDNQQQISEDLIKTLNVVEKDEVEDVKWIPVDKIDQYQWAFGHEKYIKTYTM